MICIALLFSTVVATSAFHPLEHTFGFWQRIDEGYVGHIRRNGALQDNILLPGLHFVPGAYFGTTIEPFSVLEDDDCFGCTQSDQICSPAAPGTLWCVGVKLKNQVHAEHSVDVVRKQKRDYDQRLGGFMRSSIAEVVAQKSNLEMRTTTSLNEEILHKFKTTVADAWGEGLALKIRFGSLSTEFKKCQAAFLVDEWEEQARVEARRELATLQAKTEAAQHAKGLAAADAAAATLLLETNARNARAEADAQSASTIRAIEDSALVAAATAQAEAARIKDAQELQAAAAEAELIKANPAGARHKETISGMTALGQMTKIIDVGSIGNLAAVMKSVFSG